MEKPYIKVKKLDDRARVPSKIPENAGYDLYAVIDNDFMVLRPGGLFLFPTKISIEIPVDWVFYVCERGSTGSKGIARRCGVVDSGYRGEIFVATNNTSNKPVVFVRDGADESRLDEFMSENGLDVSKVTLYYLRKAIAQGMLLYCPHADVIEVESLTDSIRGDGSLGSSGK